MENNLVIVESPAKAKTIKCFLGKEFQVKSSYGHIRDLAKKGFGIDIENDFEPNYEISPDKKKITAELKKLSKQAKNIWLASDEDREGEAIAWHLSEVLKLPEKKTKRIVFHEITKTAINNAIKNPRGIDYNLVNAQQARRVLDRLVGFNLSPLLWKKIKPSLSAGRVQSVAVRLIVEKEREFSSCVPDSAYRIYAEFLNPEQQQVNAEYALKPKTKAEAKQILTHADTSSFKITDIQVKPGKKSPAPPFITSTLQQEASRKLGLSVSRTMQVAQKLYEAGHITYMRTDSVNLSNLALHTAKQVIEKEYGKDYVKTRKYKSKIKGAQEAHEAIRPTYIDKSVAGSGAQEKKLYDLIRKRTIASQMTNASIEKTQVKIDGSKMDAHFSAFGEVIIFPGFLKAYNVSGEDNQETTKGVLPVLKIGETLSMNDIKAFEHFSSMPARYSEASLVKKMEDLGIGRPSTYAPTISTIQQRGYVEKGKGEYKTREVETLQLDNGNLIEQKKTENYGNDKGKLKPTSLGMVVNDFLMKHFKEILDYQFTAKVEKQFDEIAAGNLQWPTMIHDFYDPFIKHFKEVEGKKTKRWERELGKDPKSRKIVKAKIGKYGPYVQLGNSDDDKKPEFASLNKGQNIEDITLDEALELFKLPRKLGKYEGSDIIIGVGRYGPYIRYDNNFFSLKNNDDPYTISKDRAVELIKEGKEKNKKKEIKSFPEDKNIKILKGRYGPYISYKKKNYRIPKGKKPENMSYDECMQIVNKKQTKSRK
ncbi:MAG: type I DNA topoisomerase [Bacteroidota bacterium]|nr:type I DNA topoisomerase [Bacteroidota bacterium]